MTEKFFKTYDEQLSILSGRGIIFKDKYAYKKAKNIIQREGYYKLINGYKMPFLDTASDSEKFLPGCTIDEIFALYCFDRDIREIFLRHILHVETNVKSLIAYDFSEKYGHENYLLYKNFNTRKKGASKEISAVISDLHSAISKNHSDPCIMHYLQNHGFERVTIGISGGLDSAVVAALAVSVVGADRVNAIVMPSCYTSQASKDDARELAKRLKLRLRSIDIMPAVQTVAEAVDPLLPYWANKGLMKENIQARVRGLLLMAVSNADGSLVLNTGNKSELAVGYCTMYGDMVGGLAPLADIYKSDLYELCENVAYLREVIPQNILTKAPSAELRENQKDEDSLPNYANLDAVLKDLIEAAMDGKRLRKKYGAQFANRICQMVASSQFKHHQATLAVRLTARPICTLTPEFFHGLVSKN